MKQLQDFGLIKVIPGNNGGRFPFCNTLLIDDNVKAVVDPGAGLEILQEINESRHIDLVFDTHVHFDHIVYNYVFNQSRIMVNEHEAIYFQDRREFLKMTGVFEAMGEAWADKWLELIKQPNSPKSPFTPTYRHEWHLSLARLGGTYRWGETIDFGHTKMEIVAAPGHSKGFSVMYFPDQGIVYCGDIDLTKHGPWCEDADQFIASAHRVAELDADIFITSHQRGLVTKAEFAAELERYLEVIPQRDHQILNCIKEPMSLEDIVRIGLVYGSRIFTDEFLYCWEWAVIKEHLNRLVNQGLVIFDHGKYRRT
ncbi:MAG: MBL fold metallo-hydrolase [Methylocystaceae bacterium]